MVDFGKVKNYLISKWYFFAGALLISLLLALIFLRTTPKLYQVKASARLLDISLTEKGSISKERFITGLELISGNAELEDEIGILSSYETVTSTLDKLDFSVSYFKLHRSFLVLGDYVDDEIYRDEIIVNLNKNLPQVINVPIYISFPDENHWIISIDAEGAKILNIQNQNIVLKNINFVKTDTLMLAEEFVSEYLSFKLEKGINFKHNKADKYYFIVNSRESLAKQFTGKLKVTPISKESNIVDVSLNTTVPQRAIDFIDMLLNVYIQQELDKKNRLGLNTIGFIDSQLASVYDSLTDVEANLQSFRSANQIISISTTSENLSKQLKELNDEQASLNTKLEFLNETYTKVKKNDVVIDFISPTSMGLNDPFLNSLILQLSELNRQKIELAYSSGDGNPLLKVLEGKIENTKESLTENIGNLISSIKISLEENSKRLRQLKRKIDDLPASERNLIGIQRRFDLNDNLYNYLLVKRAEAGIAVASNLSDKSIVEHARLISTEYVSPDKKMTLIIAFLVGITFPIAVLFVGELFNNRLMSKRDLELITQRKVVGVINDNAKSEMPNTSVQFLVSNLHRKFDLKENKIIGFTSFKRLEGKAYCLLQTAAFLAKSSKVLVINSDKDRNFNFKQMLVDIASRGNLKLDPLGDPKNEIQEIFENIHYLPPTFFTDQMEDIRSGLHDLKRFFDKASATYDFILVNTQPFTTSADYLNLQPLFSVNIVVVRYNFTDKNLIKEAISTLETMSDGQNLSFVLNKVPKSKMKESGFLQ